MRKLGIVLVLAVALLLGQTLSASAAAPTILDPWPVPGAEQNLYQIFNSQIGTSFASSQALANYYDSQSWILSTLPTTTPTGTWSYALTGFFATYAGFTQSPGTNPAGNTTPVAYIDGVNFPTISGDNQIHTLLSPIAIPVPAGDFGFVDRAVDEGTNPDTVYIKYTELALNPYSPSQSNGLIFQLDVTGTQYIVAFEDGDGRQYCLGDKDYNDLVLFVTGTFTPIPLPPSALLMGSGLLGLAGLGWWRRKN